MSWQKTESIPLEHLAAFIRQITHDVRNGLNAIDLQAAYLAELSEGGEIREEVTRLRELVRATTRSLSILSRRFQEPSVEPLPCPSNLIVENLQNRVAAEFPDCSTEIQWETATGSIEAMVDVERLTEALLEILRNALQFRVDNNPIVVAANIRDNAFGFEVRERKPPPEVPPAEWTQRLLRSTRRGGYGLGLFRASACLSAQDVSLEQRYEDGCVFTRVTLPTADGS